METPHTVVRRSAPLVTVVLPVYGNHLSATTVSFVTSAWLAQCVSCEVVVATATDPVALRLPVHDGRLQVVVAEPSVRSLGLLRNIAAAAARSDVLYLGDADIVPLGRDFLSRALAVAGEGAVVVQPWMYRLIKVANLLELSPPQSDRQVCLVRANSEGRLVPVEGERFSWEGGRLWVYPPREVVHPDDSPDMIRRVPFHWGGVLVPHALFESVGGYCQRYAGWGAEDDDLLTKLASRARMIPVWRTEPAIACVHFEHPRANAGPDLVQNRAILASRRAAGIDAMLEQDRRELRVWFERSRSQPAR